MQETYLGYKLTTLQKSPYWQVTIFDPSGSKPMRRQHLHGVLNLAKVPPKCSGYVSPHPDNIRRLVSVCRSKLAIIGR